VKTGGGGGHTPSDGRLKGNPGRVGRRVRMGVSGRGKETLRKRGVRYHLVFVSREVDLKKRDLRKGKEKVR